ncbi:MAG: protein-tyrosine-phosphatase, partial [Methylobacteriaceae bacterium]|nr:protein-tyrosine-phosphatase [Methylobacteriaceae bacterium]
MRAPLSLLTVCGLDELDYHSGKGVTHVLSILDPEWPEPDVFWAFDPHDRITLHFHDAIEPAPGIILPRVEDVMAILDFGQTVVGDPDHLLVHCHAGVSRSTAAMAMILAQTDPNRAEDDILAHVTRIRPQAWPNSRVVAFADELLGRNGRLLEAVAKVYAQRLTVIPDWAGLMTRCGRGREVE